jgi:hypothetical protein
MKRRSLKMAAAFFIVLAASCNEPETVLTNVVHRDGSVTRKIVMRNAKNEFDISSIQLPVDSTWTISDSLEIGKKGDTTWVRRAEKLFRNIGEINLAYKNDSGYNRSLKRHADFKKKFRWFNTEYRFSEIIDKKLVHGYPLDKFFNEKELLWYYSPGELHTEKLSGADSLMYKALEDSTKNREELWLVKCFISEWIGDFTDLTGRSGRGKVSEDKLRAREGEFYDIAKRTESDFDSLWSSGYILNEFIGDSLATIYRAEADSAISIVTEKIFGDFKDYKVKIEMPGRLTGSNGFPDSRRIVLWPVSSSFFMAEPYEMWAVSRVSHPWAWIVSAVFVLFVITGIVVKTKKEG